MPKDETLNDIDTTDLVLQKLGDIEGVLTMRLQQAHKDGKTSKEDRDILVDLLGKIAVALTREVKDGEDGEDGEDCDPAEVAKLLEDSVSFIERVKGAKGDPGEKGADADPYELTEDDKKEMCEAVCEDVEAEMPDMVAKAVKEYVTSERLTKEINAVLKKKKITTKDVEGLSEMLKKEIDAVYEGVSKFVSGKMSGGGSLLLNALNDVDTKLLADGYTLKWDAKKKLFYFGAGGSGGGTSSQETLTKTDNYTLLIADFNKTLVMDSASNKTFTIPTATATEIGSRITFVKTNTGKVTLQLPASTTLVDSSAAGTMYNDLTNETWATVTIQLVTATKWVVVGGFGTWITT